MQRRHTKHVAVCAFRDATHRLATSRSTTSEYLVLEVIPPRNKPCTNAPQHVSKFQFNLPYLFPSHIDYNTRILFAVPAYHMQVPDAGGGRLSSNQPSTIRSAFVSSRESVVVFASGARTCHKDCDHHEQRIRPPTNDPKDQKRF